MGKYFFVDYDNTLFSHRTYRIPEGALDALIGLQKAGHKVIIASGRGFRGNLSETFGDFVPDGLASANGAFLEVEGKVLKESYCDLALQNRLIDYVQEKNYCLMGKYEGEWYVTNPERFKARQKDTPFSKGKYRSGKDFDLLRDKPMLSFFLEDEESAIADLEQRFPKLKLLRMGSSLGGADVIPLENGKAQGMMKILEHYHASLQDAVAIGDSMNDMEMIQKAGLGIAMGNAMPEVKAAADYVAKDIEQGGLCDAVEYALRQCPE